MTGPNRLRNLSAVWMLCLFAAAACKFPAETPIAATPTPTGLSASATPTETFSADTLTPTSFTPTSTATSVPPSPTATTVPPSPTATPVPATDTPDISGWLAVVGTWSGCVDDADPGVPYSALPCTAPTGNFATLWIKPHCVIGEYCGNYVRGRFESEFIRLKLTLLGIQGPLVRMHGESSSPIYASSSTDVAIQREGNRVRVTEKAGDRYILSLLRGCDSVIVENTGMGCFEYLS